MSYLSNKWVELGKRNKREALIPNSQKAIVTAMGRIGLNILVYVYSAQVHAKILLKKEKLILAYSHNF